MMGTGLLLRVPVRHQFSYYSTSNGAGQRNTTHSCASPVLSIRSESVDWGQLLGGRGLPGGEAVLKDDQKRKSFFESAEPVSGESATDAQMDSEGDEVLNVTNVEDSFDKEMMGLTGGFPGGEVGLKMFIEKNPPPSKKKSIKTKAVVTSKPVAPPPPLLMPGMTVIVNNPSNPFYMYSGIVQRVSDGRVGVLFEGGNWDKLQTFYLEELERTPQGPPMINPKSAVLLSMADATPSSASASSSSSPSSSS